MEPPAAGCGLSPSDAADPAMAPAVAGCRDLQRRGALGHALRPVTRLGHLLRDFARPLRLLWRHRVMVLVGMACVPLHAAAMLAMPGLLGRAVDGLGAAGGGEADPLGRGGLLAICQWLLLLALAETVTRYLSRRTLIDASRHVEEELKNQLVAHLQRLPVAWFDRSRTGDLVSRLTQDVELVRFVMGPLLLHGGSALCLLPAGVWLMAGLDLPVTLASAGAFGLLFVALRLLMPRLHRWSKLSQEAIGELSQRVQEDFAGIRVLHGFAATDRERAALATRNRRLLSYNLRLTRLRGVVDAITHSTTGLVLLGVLLVGGHQVIGGAITVGQLFQFMVYLGMLLFPLQVMGWTLATMPRALAAARRIEEVFAVAPEPDAGAAAVLQGRLEVRGLTFTYPGQDRPALRDVSFTLAAGEKLGLLGPVGAGKSTLLALCLRFYDPPRGTVLLDGHDVLDLSPAAVRAAFGFAPQEPFLFSDTIAANVAFARDDVMAAELDEAVRASALDQDVDQFQQGLETVVGERGVTLSGGQRQRVSLARAMASNRRALLLDDTLSAVDPPTERRILQGLRQSRRGRTVLIATHRLSAVLDADLILWLQDGAVVEQGTHRELLALDGAYAAAFRRQTEASALEGDAAAGEAAP